MLALPAALRADRRALWEICRLTTSTLQWLLPGRCDKTSPLHRRPSNALAFRDHAMYRYLLPFLLCAVTIYPASAQQKAVKRPVPKQAAKMVGPTRDVMYQLVLLIESDDQNRLPYDGPARNGLKKAGFDRMVVAGSASAAVTIGQLSSVSGTSRHGHLSVKTTMLNTTERDQVQVQINLQTQNSSPMTIDTVVRAPLGRWFLVGATESRIGLPKHADDGKRAVAVMRIDDGVLTLD